MSCEFFGVSILIAFIGIIAFIVMPSSDFQCELPKPPRLEGVLEVNEILTKAEYILKDKIFGPESIIVDEGEIAENC
ncbi:unnamed protein product [Thelazia callipaeda]|uniref:Secreted protein n=1 Tax=Thelazia callipaeda TaxID=103827 RepID=A0A0N5CTX9_THECL|nr:unnamed protein product [Thelazia callipaeda]